MGITSTGLEELGFTPEEDFVLYDDGEGVYFHEWKSSEPKPTVSEIEAAEAVRLNRMQEYQQTKQSIMESVATKIGKTVRELEEMHPVEIIYYLGEMNDGS